ncbi:MAG: T9SS type A sorting domain-containing protein [Caldithrix sp.]|nr:T9SS type A sorting domain-containing protein [Caldithrix sp.]
MMSIIPASQNWIVGINEIENILRLHNKIYCNNFITNIEAPDLIPEKYHLGQTYPNPFNPVTIIPFYLQRPENVTIKIYDLTGKEVKTIISTQLLSRGYQQVHRDGTNNFRKGSEQRHFPLSNSNRTFFTPQRLLLIQ